MIVAISSAEFAVRLGAAVTKHIANEVNGLSNEMKADYHKAIQEASKFMLRKLVSDWTPSDEVEWRHIEAQVLLVGQALGHKFVSALRAGAQEALLGAVKGFKL